MAGCTIQEFIRGMINAASKNPNLIGWKNPMSPIIDVTSIVKQVDPDVEEARLIIYGDRPDKVQVLGPYDAPPSPLPPAMIVNNWRNGQEWERQRCPHDGKYYWVVYPAKLETRGPTSIAVLGIALGILAGIALLRER